MDNAKKFREGPKLGISMSNLTGGQTCTRFLGTQWLDKHPQEKRRYKKSSSFKYLQAAEFSQVYVHHSNCNCLFSNTMDRAQFCDKINSGWWFGCHFLFSINIGFIIIPIDFHIFQRGGPTTNQKSIGQSYSMEWYVQQFWHRHGAPPHGGCGGCGSGRGGCGASTQRRNGQAPFHENLMASCKVVPQFVSVQLVYKYYN